MCRMKLRHLNHLLYCNVCVWFVYLSTTKRIILSTLLFLVFSLFTFLFFRIYFKYVTQYLSYLMQQKETKLRRKKKYFFSLLYFLSFHNLNLLCLRICSFFCVSYFKAFLLLFGLRYEKCGGEYSNLCINIHLK